MSCRPGLWRPALSGCKSGDMRSSKNSALLGAAAALSLLAACEDPAANKPRAQVSDAPASAQAAAAKPPAGAAIYAFSQENSKIEFVGSKVTGKHDGSFKTFSGTITAVEGDPTKSSVTVEVDAASIQSDNEKLTGHLKSPDFFDVEKHPKVTFRSTSIKSGGDKGATHTVAGDLTMHGVTKTITFPATIEVKGDAATVKSEFAVNRKDFGMVYPGKADDLIRDDVVIKLDIKGSKQTS